MLAQNGEERVIVQPPFVPRAKIFVRLARRAACVVKEIPSGFPQQWQLVRANSSKVDGALCVRNPREPRSIEISALYQALKADHQNVPGERRGAGIRRVPVAHGTKRKDLPQRLLGSRQPIRELISSRTKITNPAARGQRRWMHQET